LRNLQDRALPSPSLIISVLALIVAVGGGAFAIAASDGKKIRRIANRVVTKRAPKLSVLHATSAGTASVAVSAGIADSARTINGVHLGKVDTRIPPGTGQTTVFSANGLTLSATCSAAGALNLTGTTSVGDAEIYEQGGHGSTFHSHDEHEFDPGGVEEVGLNLGDGTQDGVSGLVVYSTANGDVVTIVLSITESAHGGSAGCAVEGTAVFS
jgi:hypothetical protein